MEANVVVENLGIRMWGAFLLFVCSISQISLPEQAVAQTREPPARGPVVSPIRDVLTPREWAFVDDSVDRALSWLASRQQRDGSFPTFETGQPAVTALGVLAFLSNGYLPGEGPYGRTIDAGINFVRSCQRRNGLISYLEPPPRHESTNAAHTGHYNHAIGGLLLTEVYGMLDRSRSEEIRPVIERAIDYTRRVQLEPKESRLDLDAWRYVHRHNQARSDLSVTSWQIMFLRSAKNAGFEIPGDWIDGAIGYVHRCYDERNGVFFYANNGPDIIPGRGMTAAGILCLSLGGMHDTDMARRAGNWILRNPINRYNATVGRLDRFHYGVFYCSQAMLQLGGDYWAGFYPQMVNTMLQNQSPQGFWDRESGGDGVFGNHYSTALSVLALTSPHQILPIFQR
jgi:hypothetical protein